MPRLAKSPIIHKEEKLPTWVGKVAIDNIAEQSRIDLDAAQAIVEAVNNTQALSSPSTQSSRRWGGVFHKIGSLEPSYTPQSVLDRHLVFKAVESLQTHARKNGMASARVRYLRAIKDNTPGKDFPLMKSGEFLIEFLDRRGIKHHVKAVLSLDATGRFILPATFLTPDGAIHPFTKDVVADMTNYKLVVPNISIQRSMTPTYRHPDPTRVWPMSSVANLRQVADELGVDKEDAGMSVVKELAKGYGAPVLDQGNQTLIVTCPGGDNYTIISTPEGWSIIDNDGAFSKKFNRDEIGAFKGAVEELFKAPPSPMALPVENIPLEDETMAPPGEEKPGEEEPEKTVSGGKHKSAKDEPLGDVWNFESEDEELAIEELQNIVDEAINGDTDQQNFLCELWHGENWYFIKKKLETEGSVWYVWWMDGVHAYMRYMKHRIGAKEKGSTMEKPASVVGYWQGEPKGWTAESKKKFWKSIGGSVKECIKKLEGKVDNPAAFCAGIKDEVKGKTTWRGPESSVKDFSRFLRVQAAAHLHPDSGILLEAARLSDQSRTRSAIRKLNLWKPEWGNDLYIAYNLSKKAGTPPELDTKSFEDGRNMGVAQYGYEGQKIAGTSGE